MGFSKVLTFRWSQIQRGWSSKETRKRFLLQVSENQGNSMYHPCTSLGTWTPLQVHLRAICKDSLLHCSIDVFHRFNQRTPKVCKIPKIIFKLRDVFSVIAAAACCVSLYFSAVGLERDKKETIKRGQRGLFPPQHDNEVELCTYLIT